MKNIIKYGLISAGIACATSSHAKIEVYENEGFSFSADGLVNAFYSNSSIEHTDATGATSDRDQSRVRMGFLPNNVGFNFANQMSDMKIEMRSSFWVSINDSDNFRDASPADLGTGSLIDVRQFYATISGDWGEVLLGKDFGLFNRSNILNDELLLGFGQTSDFFGLVDGGNVSFGNISTGYTYPFPKAQITYRSPEINGFKIALGLMDPNKSAADSSEDLPRFEAELTYNTTFEDGSFKAWLSGVSQSSEHDGVDENQSGVGYGANVKFAGVALTASGYSSKGLGFVAGLDQFVGDESIETDGFLVQASYTLESHRFVLTHGQTKVENTNSILDAKHRNTGVAYFNTIRSGLTAVVEYNHTQADVTDALTKEDNDTISIGAVVTF
ncbi:porin [uncultured Paraglaciecola sp.]|uniref:porin n=1 Tax=uncultured Paraglaciecola sp. TaxID=1765024 RepID=UPI0030D9A4D8|tara:strand:- start:4245 stop:5402 length:1158 start_codon:yes stop_codon:yes gene_type:complete